MNPSALADRLNVNSDTIRRWANTYATYLSPGANPARGKSRSFSDHDARILLLVSTLRDSGIDHNDIDLRLKELQNDSWSGLPELPLEWGLDEESVPVGVAVSKAADIAQIAVLRAELENARQALESAQGQVHDLQSSLANSQSENETLKTRLQTIEIEAERLRGQVNTLEARLSSYGMAYSLGRSERPVSAVTLVMLVAAATVILVLVIAVVVVLITP
jgi:DNA-binding transcriptional MerR regulator